MHTLSDTYRVYLHKLDINEGGVALTLEDAQIDRYLLSFSMVFDRVILQTSAFFKRRDLCIRLEMQPYLFTALYHGFPIISSYRGVGEESFSQYLETRYSILSNGSRYNAEYLAYRENDAKEIARKLDYKIPLDNLPGAAQDTDKVFRQLVVSRNNDAVLSTLPNAEKIRKEMRIFAKNADVFQTFYLIDKIQNRARLSAAGAVRLGNQLRQNYFQANAQANECFSIADSHVKYEYIQKYLHMTSLYTIIESLNAVAAINAIIDIKEADCYKRLQYLYFRRPTSDIEELYQIYVKGGRGRHFLRSREFHRFFDKRAMNYEVYRQAFAQMHEIVNYLRKVG